MNVQKLEEELAISFRDKQLLQQAFTHSSYVNEHQRTDIHDNERLEFLGDAVLELAVSEFLFKKYKNMSEGDLTKLRASIVCEESLYHFSELLHFHEYVLLGKGEERTGGRHRQALLADVFEAFLGALYIDRGMNACEKFLREHIFPHVSDEAFSYVMDYKTELQELIQQEKGNKLKYRIIAEKGPSHAKESHAEVILNEKERATGIGKSKKEAEQFAAQNLLEKLTSK